MKCIIFEKRLIVIFSSLFVLLLFCGIFGTNYLKTSNNKRKIPIYSVQTDKKVVAITFDSAWDNTDLQDILTTLNNYKCKATFFVVGEFLDKYKTDVETMHKNGHEIANHSDTHPHPNLLSREQIIKELNDCDQKIKAITGQKEVLFRPPYGEYNNLLVQTCEDTNRFCIQWDCDSLDWKGLTPEDITNRVLSKVKNGSIVLLHNGAKHTAQALPMILSSLKNQGYEFVTVSDLIYKDNYTIDNNGVQTPK